MSRYQLIRACTEPWPVQLLCRVLGVSPTGYFQWQQRPAWSTAEWQQAAQVAFTRHARRYGTRRLRAELQAEGHAVGRYPLRSWLHRNDLRALSTPPPHDRRRPGRRGGRKPAARPARTPRSESGVGG